MNQLDELQLQDRVQLFNDFVASIDFFAILAVTDYLLPLVHPNTPSAEQYIVNQISGSFTLSFGLKIPLLIHAQYNTEEDLKHSSFFYTCETFEIDFKNASRKITEKIVEIESIEKWKSAFQYNNYLNFIKLFS